MATYVYENSDAERFQQLVQALLVADLPRLQCLPVGQPDGGRDGIVYDDTMRPSEVLQVKFKKVDDEFADSADWMIAALEGELPKVRRLIERGLKRYLVATNARATSHLDVGGVDRVQTWLTQNIAIPAQCLWRDDLDRRLEGSIAVQWRYPEVLSGPDAIHLALVAGITEDKDRRSTALKQFLAYQFKRDAEVRFKQVDLRNDLLSLFIDVPATVSPRRGVRAHAQEAFMEAYHRIPSAEWLEEQPAEEGFGRQSFFPVGIGTADLLLDAEFARRVPRIVLEGAPGQGKSTLAQYVCQVHRARLLEAREVLEALPERHRFSAVKLPIKVDLRDLATWLNNQDPFLPDNPVAGPGWAPELEAFIARQISANSGGIAFSSYDVTASLRNVPTLLFLDGLDEVAGIPTREGLIEAVRTGIARLQASGVEPQLVVTSRPAAFANSPGFASSEYAHLELTNLSRELVLNYSERWISARRLDELDSAEVRRILASKLDLPHIRELARNPMQLAILLSLIHSVGYSLPDERTDLYSSYMDRFLTREADKSPAVRKHRKLLVKIHQHLAWILQSRAESTSGLSGSVTPDELRGVIGAYLREHEYSTEILDELFTGVLERVYVLVQRIEGTYEFEVQPLREYFCAKYLYDTAAAYEAGQDGDPKGSKSDRFDALARNPYWTNVVRFYAGCYRSGELGGLFMQLEELREEDGRQHTYRPRQLGAMLLGDWVFKEAPRVTRHVVGCVFDDLGLKGAATAFGQGAEHPLVLPVGCGRDELADAAVTALARDLRSPSLRDLSRLARGNLGEGVAGRVWRELATSSHEERTAWISFASQSDLVRQFPERELVALMTDDHPTSEEFEARCRQVFHAAPAIAERNSEIWRPLLSLALSGRLLSPRHRRPSWLAVLGAALAPGAARITPDRPSVLRQFLREPEVDQLVAGVPADLGAVKAFLSDVTAFEFAGDQKDFAPLAAGERHVDAVQKHLGTVWSVYALAALYAGIPAPRGDRGEDATSLFDASAGLVASARRARYWTGGSRWWAAQLENAQSLEDRMFWCLMVMLWGGPRTVAELQSRVERVLDELSPANYLNIYAAAGICARSGRGAAAAKRREISADGRSDRFVGLVEQMLTHSTRADALCAERPASREPVIQRTRELAQLRKLLETLGLENCDAGLPEIRRLYRRLGVSPMRALQGRRVLTKTAAQTVLANPLDFPSELVTNAEQEVAKGLPVQTVASVAVNAGWTFE